MPESAIEEIKRLCREAGPDDDPLLKATVMTAELQEGCRKLIEDVRLIAAQSTAPEAAQKLAAAAARGASQGTRELARAHIYRTAFLASLALAVAVVVAFGAGRWSVDDSFQAACLKIGKVEIDKGSGRPYCSASVWIGEARR